MLAASGSITQSGSLSTNAASNSTGNGGTISVIADLTNPNSLTTVSGAIAARGGDLGGNGGQIETSASKVKITAKTTIDTSAPKGTTGEWTIDPTDFYISSASTGSITGDTPSGDISGATLSAALGSSNVTILSSTGSTNTGTGDIHVNDAVSWSSNTLTMTAAHSVNINAVMTSRGDSKLVMNTSTANGMSSAVAGGAVNVGLNTNGTFKGQVNFDRSGSGFLAIDGEHYTVINSLGSVGSLTASDLQGMSGNLNGRFALGQNIDASATSSWTSCCSTPPGRP
jgi:hypothetical protein